jgi:hypothetical protein
MGITNLQQANEQCLSRILVGPVEHHPYIIQPTLHISDIAHRRATLAWERGRPG